MSEKEIKLTYKESMQRLEEIVSTIEHNNPDVDDLTKLVAEAIDLVNFCRKKLTTADKKLEELMTKLD